MATNSSSWCFSTAVAMMLATTMASAAPQIAPTQAELSDSALAAELGAVSESVRRESLNHSRNLVLKLSSTKPDSRSGAVVVFKAGLNPVRLSELASQVEFEVTRAEAKVAAVDGSADVTTISIGADDLLRFKGPLNSRLDASLARIRARFYIMSTQAEGADARRLYDVAVAPEFVFYKVHVIATNRALLALSENPTAAAILVNEDPELVSSHEKLKTAIADQIVNSPFGGVRPLMPHEDPTRGEVGGVPSRRELNPASHPELRGKIRPRPSN